jgi:hypothetical protein
MLFAQAFEIILMWKNGPPHVVALHVAIFGNLISMLNCIFLED